MTAVIASPKAHRVGRPVRLTESDIQSRREEIEGRFMPYEDLLIKKDRFGLNADEYMALQDLEALRFLEGK